MIPILYLIYRNIINPLILRGECASCLASLIFFCIWLHHIKIFSNLCNFIDTYSAILYGVVKLKMEMCSILLLPMRKCIFSLFPTSSDVLHSRMPSISFFHLSIWRFVRRLTCAVLILSNYVPRSGASRVLFRSMFLLWLKSKETIFRAIYYRQGYYNYTRVVAAAWNNWATKQLAGRELLTKFARYIRQNRLCDTENVKIYRIVCISVVFIVMWGDVMFSLSHSGVCWFCFVIHLGASGWARRESLWQTCQIYLLWLGLSLPSLWC